MSKLSNHAVVEYLTLCAQRVEQKKMETYIENKINGGDVDEALERIDEVEQDVLSTINHYHPDQPFFEEGDYDE